MSLYNNKILTEQQWNSLPAYKKYQMRYRTPALYNYYQDRYVTKAEPVAQKRTIEAEDGMLGSLDSDIKPVAYEAPALAPLTTGSMERRRISDPIGSVGNSGTQQVLTEAAQLATLTTGSST